MAAEPFWAKYVRADERRARRAEDDAHVSELTLALEATRWFARGGLNDRI